MPEPSTDRADRTGRLSADTRHEGDRAADAPAPSRPESRSAESSTGPVPPPLPLVRGGFSRLTLRRCFRSVGPWGISFLFHSLLLITLALCFASQLTSGLNGSVSLTANPDDDLYDELLESTFLQDDISPGDTDDLATQLLTESMRNVDQVYRELELELTDDVEMGPLPPENLMDVFGLENLGSVVGDIDVTAELAGSRIQEAGTVEQAVGGVFGHIKDKADRGDLLVVWMFDASISLVDDRQRVAEQMERFFDQIKTSKSDDSHVFMHAAVAFGGNVRELLAPTTPNRKMIDAVRNVPVDNTGRENVFSAVEWVVNRYGKRWKHELEIVIWADESGDDLSRLEHAVADCRRRHAAVSVVGPSAILGREIGTHTWIHAPTRQVFLLPVNRGPDSAHPQRLRLPYWFETSMPELGGALQAGTNPNRGPANRLPPWYGGDQLEGLVSGFGPYGMVRLAVETGGSYTIFDRPSDRGPFRLDTMRPYLPDYRVADDILDEIRHHPLREAVVQTAALTLQTLDLQPPEMNFFDRPSRYLTPAEFRDMLKASLPAQLAVARHTVGVTERALTKFGPDGMEELYLAEKSPRWKAWYDLTRGRLLAVKVRCFEYDYACGILLNSLHPGTNRVTFGPISELRHGPIAQLAAEESGRLLERCVRENPGTPWAYLARRELDYPLGVGFQQQVIPAPPPKTAGPPKPATKPRPPTRPITPPRL